MTKVVCTIGPSTDQPDMIAGLMEHGMVRSRKSKSCYVIASQKLRKVTPAIYIQAT